jgi:peptidoglycan-associated lipoprotein
MKRTIAAIFVAAAVAGCASDPTPTTATASRTPSAAPAPSTAARTPSDSAASRPANTANASGRATGAASAPSQRSVYFDYDSNLVKEEYAPVVKANAHYLSARRAPVRVEGNTDERGSREYNLALGQRRAEAIKQRLTLLGVPAQSIETVSFGEEKPRADGENEQAFAENRRADIVYGR